jgi:hypothetical protein
MEKDCLLGNLRELDTIPEECSVIRRVVLFKTDLITCARQLPAEVSRFAIVV